MWQPCASLNRLTAWGLTIQGLGRAEITAIGLRSKSGCRQADSEVNIAVLVSWRSYRGLGHDTLRLWVQAVYFSFILSRCHGGDGADLYVVPHWDVMWCDVAGALTEIQESHITKGRKCLFLTSQKMPLNYTLPTLLKLWHHPENSLIQKSEEETCFCTSYLGHIPHSDNSWFLSLFQPQEQRPEPRIHHLVDKCSVLLPFRNILSAVNCCIAADLFCVIASILANSSRGRIWVLSKYVPKLLNLHFSLPG